MNKKALAIVALLVLIVGAFSVSAKKDDSCTDSDSGLDIWTPGHTTNQYNMKFSDDCDGASQNLKERICDGTKPTHDNVKCSDYGAVCVSVYHGDDYCACPEGTHFQEGEEVLVASDSISGSCVPNENQIPEFGGIAAGVALGGAGLAFATLRRRK